MGRKSDDDVTRAQLLPNAVQTPLSIAIVGQRSIETFLLQPTVSKAIHSKSLVERMLLLNPQLEHHLDTFDDKSTTSNDDAQLRVRQGSLKEDASVPEEIIVNAYPLGRNNKQNQESMKERIWNPIFEWVGMGFLGYYLGCGSCTVGGIVLLCSLACLFWEMSHHILQRRWQRRQQQEENQLAQCRIELSKLLASIGAAPLKKCSSSLLDNNTANTTTIHCYHFILEFATAHVNFLRQVDSSLDTLRTAVGIHLRTTHVSVDRVELNRLCHHNYVNKKHVLLPTARRMLSRIILDQYKSLQNCYSLLPLLDENLNSNNNNHDDDDNDDDSTIQLPNVMTLAWLKFIRHELADLLSFQLSQLMSCQEMLHNLSRFDGVLRQRFCSSIRTALESTEYLSCMFSLSSPSPAIIAESSDWLLPSELHMLCQQFNTASVALWACRELCDRINDDDSECNNNNNNNNKNNTSSSGIVLEFLEQIESLLHSVEDVKESLRQNLHRTVKDDGEAAERNEKMEESCLDQSEREVQHSDPEDYVHSGQSFLVELQNVTAGEHMVQNNKTVVFSASGTMAQLVGNKKDTAAGNNSTLWTSPPRQFIATQRMVFEELQQRLAKMDRAEEVGADESHILQESDAQPVGHKKKPSTTFMFLGPSGDVLTELKNSIKNGKGWSLSLGE